MQPIASSASRSHPKRQPCGAPPLPTTINHKPPFRLVDTRTRAKGLTHGQLPLFGAFQCTSDLHTSTYVHPPIFIHLLSSTYIHPTQNHFSDLQTSCQNHASDLHTFCFITQVHKSVTLSHALIGPNRRPWPWLCHWPPKRLEEQVTNHTSLRASPMSRARSGIGPPRC